MPARYAGAVTAVAFALTSGIAQADIQSKEVTYTVGGDPYTGYIAWDGAVEGERPGVLVVHEWWGHGDYVRERARQLAELGYTGFALDMYGEGKRADHPEKAKEFSQAAMSNLDQAEERFRAAMDRLAQHPSVNDERIAAQGYCFGGGVVLAMARRGVELDGVVSFHGNLGAGEPADEGDIEAAVRVHTGGADEFVPAAQVADFVEAMHTAGADYAVHSYPGVKHSFTNPAADDHAEAFGLPIAYDAQADQRSWEATKAFYSELFAD